MKRIRVLGIILSLLVPIVVPNAVQAQQLTHVFKLIYSPTNVTLTTSSGATGTWNSGLWGLDYRLLTVSPWGFHLQWASGSQSGWAGIVAPTTSGTDTAWSADVTYQFAVPSARVLGFLGYGALNSTLNGFAGPGVSTQFNSSGFRLGAEASLPLQANWSVNGSLAWFPSNATSVGNSPGSTVNGSGSTTAWQASIRYALPPAWTFEVGYRGANVSSGVLSGTICSPNACTFQTSGWLIGVGIAFR